MAIRRRANVIKSQSKKKDEVLQEIDNTVVSDDESASNLDEVVHHLLFPGAG